MKMAQLVLHKLFQRSYKMKRQVASFKISGLGSVRRQKWQNKAPGMYFFCFMIHGLIKSFSGMCKPHVYFQLLENMLS